VGARDRHRAPPDEYIFNATFHPTFLYEALWNLLAAGALLLLDRRLPLPARRRSSRSTSSLYTGFRFYLETLRIDPPRSSPAARERLGLADPLRRLARLLHLLAVLPRPPGPAEPPRRPRRIEPKQTMAVPSGRVRPRR
jgi:hypothetical protein